MDEQFPLVSLCWPSQRQALHPGLTHTQPKIQLSLLIITAGSRTAREEPDLGVLD